MSENNRPGDQDKDQPNKDPARPGQPNQPGQPR